MVFKIQHVDAAHEGKKPHKCSICDYSTANKGYLKKQIEAVHEGKKPHKCSEVHFVSFLSGGFTTMAVINPPERKLAKRTSVKCSICDYNTSDKGSLKKQVEAVHQGKKPHKCSMCDYSVSTKPDLKKHIRAVHQGKKQHKCSICYFNTSDKQHFKKHITFVHERVN